MHAVSLPESEQNDQNHESDSRLIVEARIRLCPQGGRIRGAVAALAILFLITLAIQARAESGFASWARLRYDAILASITDFGSDYFGKGRLWQDFPSPDEDGTEAFRLQPASPVQMSLYWKADDPHPPAGKHEAVVLAQRSERSDKLSALPGGFRIGPLQFRYGRLLVERSVLTQGWNGTAWEEPRYALLSANFSF